MKQSDRRAQAKRVILEIVRQSPGDEIEGKIRLFKAFYFAHLYYAMKSADYLTDWPIVKMPLGPGIDDFPGLIGELVAEGLLTQEQTMVGPYRTTLYRATERFPAQPLSAEAVAAIHDAVTFVADKTGAQLSDITHEFSYSWNQSELGDEQNIYQDLLSDEQREENRKRVNDIGKDIKAVWN
ncbi:MAG: hypothetical protein JW818_06725 [Pirellulales bacterium]|nr:hypothetical protein [Pirellulales bacterium]